MSTPTAPLSPAAAAAVRSLELALTIPVEIVQAVTRYEVASARAAQLSAVAASGEMTDLDADSLAHAEDVAAGARAALAKAGRLDLIGGAA
jgi:hypothetical protein